MTRYVRVICPCGEEWDDVMTYERDTGASYLGRDECSKCGTGASDLRVEDLDELDIQERRLEARGIDF
jgi:hypothetical protein